MSGKKILVALSGGVDSAVAAALLKKQGFAVFGIYFCFFDGESAKKSLNKAKKAAKSLDIPLEIVDARKEFKKKVVDYFIDSYKKGITPNPCVICNKEMKFRLLFDLMKKKKADAIATGHYARINFRFSKQGSTFPLSAEASNSSRSNLSRIPQGRTLREAKDKTKDQSYFLYRLTQKELAKIIFSLGELKKNEVKKLAKKFKLPVFEDEESQDVCFMQSNDLNTYLNKYLGKKPGNVSDESRKKIGRHQGLPFYTIGQRKGIEIGGTGPYFVIGKNSRKNELVVSNDPKKLLVKKFEVKNVNWTSGKMKLPMRADVQIRYHAPKVSAIIKKSKLGKLVIEAKKPLRAVTPGQSAVFYKNSEVLGGGIIIG